MSTTFLTAIKTKDLDIKTIPGLDPFGRLDIEQLLTSEQFTNNVNVDPSVSRDDLAKAYVGVSLENRTFSTDIVQENHEWLFCASATNSPGVFNIIETFASMYPSAKFTCMNLVNGHITESRFVYLDENKKPVSMTINVTDEPSSESEAETAFINNFDDQC